MTEEDIAKIKRYRAVFPKAWKKFLEDIKGDEIMPPRNEDWMRCYLFSECISIMRDKNFKIPYEIAAEDSEIDEGRKADLTLGLLDERDFETPFRTVAVIEIKYVPSLEGVLNDLTKIRDYTRQHAIAGFFVMIEKSKSTSGYRQKEVEKKLNELGIESYKWATVKSKRWGLSFETLMVELRSSAES